MKLVTNVTQAWAAIMGKRAAYRFTFLGPDGKPHHEGKQVLKDLRKFCAIDKPGIVVSPVTRMCDPNTTIYRSGMRDVYLRIVKYLNLEEIEDDRSADTDLE